jgi:hypothetical protein
MKDKFFEFLRQEGAFETWHLNFFREYKGEIGDAHEKIDKFLRKDNMLYWIAAAFTFLEATVPSSITTDEAGFFWWRIDNKWREIVRNQPQQKTNE